MVYKVSRQTTESRRGQVGGEIENQREILSTVVLVLINTYRSNSVIGPRRRTTTAGQQEPLINVNYNLLGAFSTTGYQPAACYCHVF